MTSDADEYTKAAREVAVLRSLRFREALIIQALVRKYSREIVQRLFPDAELPQETAALPADLIQSRFGDGAGQGASIRSGPQPVASIQSAKVGDKQLSTPASQNAVDELAFHYVPLIQCTFPHSNPGSITSYSRRNGRLELTISASKEGVGLPYGVPARILAIYAATEVVRTRDREIYLGRTITEFLRRLQITPVSGRRGSLTVFQDQTERLVHSVFTIEEDMADGGGRLGIHIRKVLFAEEARLWNDGGAVGRGSSILLSQPLYESMLERSAPLSFAAICRLRKSPMDLDVYAWLVYRLHRLNRPLLIPWSELALQFGQSYTRERDFRSFFQASLKRVHRVYPEARVEPLRDGLRLLPSKSHIRSQRAVVGA